MSSKNKLYPMKVRVELIDQATSLDAAFFIRERVFVEEQEVAAEEEYDEFEDSSRHFLARLGDLPVGTARWRFTPNGVKLERFAVLKEHRGQGVGQALVAAVLADIEANPNAIGKTKYLHAQLHAMPLYAKFGFQQVGEMFEECAILHFKMTRS